MNQKFTSFYFLSKVLSVGLAMMPVLCLNLDFFIGTPLNAILASVSVQMTSLYPTLHFSNSEATVGQYCNIVFHFFVKGGREASSAPIKTWPDPVTVSYLQSPPLISVGSRPLLPPLLSLLSGFDHCMVEDVVSLCPGCPSSWDASLLPVGRWNSRSWNGTLSSLLPFPFFIPPP